jgi:spermidine synthase
MKRIESKYDEFHARSPWKELERVQLEGGDNLALYERNGEFMIRANGRELMSSTAHLSEEQLGELGCAHLKSSSNARVLVGGLGLGYTLAAALRVLPFSAEVVVVELVREFVNWNLTLTGQGAGHPLRDRRVRIVIDDVQKVLARSQGQFDAVVLDVDNGRGLLSYEKNAHLYSADGMHVTRASLRTSGALAIWSDREDPQLEEALTLEGFATSVHNVPARGAGDPIHTIILGLLEGK